MDILRQIGVVTALNFKSLPTRAAASLVLLISMACAIGVLISMLSVTAGFMRSELSTGDPGRAIIMSSSAESESQSRIPRNDINPITDAPGILKDADGSTVADAEVLTTIVGTRKVRSLFSPLLVRGIGGHRQELRPELNIIAGRMIRPGAAELIVGAAAQRQFANLDIGDRVIMPDGQWPVVGIFATGGDTLEGEILADADTLMGAMRRKTYNSVILRFDSPNSLSTLQRALTENPALAVTVDRHSDYYRRTSQQYADFFNGVAYTVGCIMALGALFGSINIIYSSVSGRTQEIATLRALGFGGLPVAVSVIAEALALSLAGALLGELIAYALFNGRLYVFGQSIFSLTVTARLIGLGIGWAFIIGLFGALLPAARAANIEVVTALRAL